MVEDTKNAVLVTAGLIRAHARSYHVRLQAHEFFAHLVIPLKFPNGRSVAAWYIPVLSQGCTTRRLLTSMYTFSHRIYIG
jgi:hypothetical protein